MKTIQKRTLAVAAAAALGLGLISSSAFTAPGEWHCPGYGPGYGMGPGMMRGYGYGPGYGMGPGMMWGYGYGPDYGMGPGMIQGYGYGYGPGMHRQGRLAHGHPGQWAKAIQQRHQEQLELLQERLQIKPDQKEAWQAFSKAWESHPGFKGKGWQQRQKQGQTQPDAVTFFNNRVQFMEARLVEMKNLAQAADKLYATLSPEQKKIMDDFFATRPRFGWR
jgi:hypothetical protein